MGLCGRVHLAEKWRAGQWEVYDSKVVQERGDRNFIRCKGPSEQSRRKFGDPVALNPFITQWIHATHTCLLRICYVVLDITLLNFILIVWNGDSYFPILQMCKYENIDGVYRC